MLCYVIIWNFMEWNVMYCNVMSCHVMSCHVMSCILCCCFFIMTREIKSTTELSISRHLTAVQHNVPVLGQLKSEDECLGALSLTLPLSPAYTSSFSCLHFLFLLLTLPCPPTDHPFSLSSNERSSLCENQSTGIS